jgi:hypothetical protein
VIQLNGHCERSEANQKNGEHREIGVPKKLSGLPRCCAPRNDDLIVGSLTAGAIK